MAFSDVIARLAVSLSLDTAAFQTGSRKAQREVTGLQGHMTKAAKAIGAALAGMVTWETIKTLRDWTQAAVDSAGALGEQAAALGVTTTELQEYRYAATQVGLEQAEMDKGLEQLTRRMGEAAIAGKGPLVDAFKAVGLSLDDLKGKSAGEVIPLIADGLAKIEDPAQRAAISVDLFGRAGQKLATLLAGGAEGVNTLRQAAHDLGIVLSEEDIAHADEVADKVAALRFVLEAQQNKKLLENADALLKYEEAVAELKNGLIDFVNFLDAHPPDSVVLWLRHALNPGTVLENFKREFNTLADVVSGAIGRMVTSIRQWIAGRLDAVWDHVQAKINAVKAAFRNLWDAVVGHSYIPDMVDGIAAEMGRLDAVMVAPVTAATGKAKQAFRDMAEQTLALLDKLFPEVRALMEFETDRGTIGRLPEGQRDEAFRRLLRNAAGVDVTNGVPFSGRPDFGEIGQEADHGGIGRQAIDDWLEVQDRIRKAADETRVRVAKSFKDMADDTLGALSRLTGAIRSGGFLGILEAVIGFGLQLGSIGLFGKTIAGRLNATARAGGGPVVSGRPYLVGERGPELVVPRHNGRVIPNGGFGGNVYNISGNLLTPEFWAQIQSGDLAAARAGAEGGMARLSYAQSRRVG